MSLTKENPAFDRMMEENRLELDNSHERYLEEQYLGVPVRRASPSGFPLQSPAQEPEDFHSNPSRASVLSGKTCAYCNAPTAYVDSSVVYRRSYGMIYMCSACRAWVGVHKGTSVALGRVANAELRDLKKSVHAVFDPIWKQGHLSRGKAYGWLALRMDLSIQECHVGMFDEKQCRLAIGILEEWEGVTTEL